MNSKKSILSLLIFSSVIFTANSQSQVSDLFKAGISDLNTLANGYLKPLGNGIATGMASNWYNTADVHGVLGFDLTIGANAVFTPTDDQSFSLAGLQNLKATNGATSAPSFGGSGNGVSLDLYQPAKLSNGTANPWAGQKIVSFTSPKGVSKIIPSPSVQLTIGLPVINDLSIRFMPKIKTGDTEASMWGVGIKHNFKRWIPGLKLLPFDAAALVAYNHFDYQYMLPAGSLVTPSTLVTNNAYSYSGTMDVYNGQNMNVKANAFTAGIIVSKKLLFITPYAGFGYTHTKFDLAMAGTYPTLGDPVVESGTVKMKIVNTTDPLKVSQSLSMANLTLGLRLKMLGVLTLHGQYVMQKYPVASVGLGVSIR